MVGCGEQYPWSSHILSDGQPQHCATHLSSDTQTQSRNHKSMLWPMLYSRTLCLVVKGALWFIPTKSQKSPAFKIATLWGKMRWDSFHGSAWEWENRGNPSLERDQPVIKAQSMLTKEACLCGAFAVCTLTDDTLLFDSYNKVCVPISQIRKVKPKEVSWLMQGHSAESIIIWFQVWSPLWL